LDHPVFWKFRKVVEVFDWERNKRNEDGKGGKKMEMAERLQSPLVAKVVGDRLILTWHVIVYCMRQALEGLKARDASKGCAPTSSTGSRLPPVKH